MSDTEGERSEKRYERVDLPPTLKNGTNYQEWLRDVEIWQCVTNLPEKKQGPALYRALQGHAKATCSSIAVKDLCEKDGMKILIEKLDKLFAKDKEQLRRQGGVRGQKNMSILFERFHRCGVNAFYGMSKFYSVQKLSVLE